MKRNFFKLSAIAFAILLTNNASAQLGSLGNVGGAVSTIFFLD